MNKTRTLIFELLDKQGSIAVECTGFGPCGLRMLNEAKKMHAEGLIELQYIPVTNLKNNIRIYKKSQKETKNEQ